MLGKGYETVTKGQETFRKLTYENLRKILGILRFLTQDKDTMNLLT